MPFCDPSKIIIPENRFRDVETASQEYKELVISIEEIGQLQSILVSATPIFLNQLEPDQFELIDGLHRLTACKELKKEVWYDTDANARLTLDSPELRRTAELHTAVRRKDFTPQQKALAVAEIDELMRKKYGDKKSGPGQEGGWGYEDTAKKLGFKSHSSVVQAVHIATAIKTESVPGIEKAKTTTEAMKMIKDKIRREVVVELTKREAGLTTTEIGDPFEYFGKRIIEGSCIKIKEQPAGICNLFITDPPWKIGINTKKYEEGQTTQKCLEVYDDSSEDIFPLLDTIIKEMTRVGKPDCWVVMFCAVKHWYWLRDKFRENNFQVYSKPLVWVRTRENGAIYRGKSAVPSIWPSSLTDFMILARKGNAVLSKMNEGDAFLSPPVTGVDKIHHAQKPVSLLMEIINRFYFPETNQLLIDPFAGSGSTLVAARKLGIKNYFGYELSPTNREKAISYMVREYLEEEKVAKVVVDLSDFPDSEEDEE